MKMNKTIYTSNYIKRKIYVNIKPSH